VPVLGAGCCVEFDGDCVLFDESDELDDGLEPLRGLF
jgi:hypothetical protein